MPVNLWPLTRKHRSDFMVAFTRLLTLFLLTELKAQHLTNFCPRCWVHWPKCRLVPQKTRLVVVSKGTSEQYKILQSLRSRWPRPLRQDQKESSISTHQEDGNKTTHFERLPLSIGPGLVACFMASLVQRSKRSTCIMLLDPSSFLLTAGASVCIPPWVDESQHPLSHNRFQANTNKSGAEGGVARQSRN
ncbi:hypothetical protein JOL62DRAFT_328036 [Phyllosticta paracitricarpa]|uniref:Secreted protein n=1 Tax=Phyllosticta paracitricarpa TaxID=2016321 RepID=A0ABR1MW11_9PEZI